MRSMRVIRPRVGLEFTKPSLTKQSFVREADINVIMARYEKDGLIAHVNRVQGSYGDFTDPPEYQEALNKVIAAQDMFMSLPARIRARFGNDPGEFLAFVQDEKNVPEMVKMGLAVERVPAEPVSVVVKEMPADKPADDKK